jgi:ATP-dependent protease ClpP protease subunit
VFRTRALMPMALLMLLLILFTGRPAGAAEFHADFPDNLTDELQGIIAIKGEISAGDHLKLLKVLGDREGDKGYLIVLELDSPGGSFDEAIQITDVMKERYLSTRIKANSQCLSACAIIFMAGNRITSGGPALTRELHARGTLGFHAPTIALAGGKFDGADLQAAYAAAIESIGGKLLAVARYRDIGWDTPMIKSDLVNEMMLKQGSNFYYIDTVGRAAENDIDVVGAGGPADLYQHVKDACANAIAKLYSSSVAKEEAEFPGETSKSVVKGDVIYKTVLGLAECKITLASYSDPTSGGGIDIDIRKSGGKQSTGLSRWMYWPADKKLSSLPPVNQSK